MTEKQVTLDEFVELMEKWTKETYNGEARLFIREWKGLATEEQWKIIGPLPLRPDMVMDFAQSAAAHLWLGIEGTCSEPLYTRRCERAHAFLRAIYEKAVELGMQVDLKKIDVPLTPSDLLVFSGLAERRMVDGHYEIKLKEKGGGAKMAKKQIIKITNVPEGPGIPEEIRRGWVGAVFEAEGPTEMAVGSVLSQSDGPYGVKLVYKTPSGLALAALKLQNKQSWEWFNSQPRLSPFFAFNSECCEVVRQ